MRSPTAGQPLKVAEIVQLLAVVRSKVVPSWIFTVTEAGEVIIGDKLIAATETSLRLVVQAGSVDGEQLPRLGKALVNLTVALTTPGTVVVSSLVK